MCDKKSSPPASTYAASPLSPLRLRGCGSNPPPPPPPSPAPPGAARPAAPWPGAGDPQTWFLARRTVNTARLLEQNKPFYQRFPSKPESMRVTCKHKPFFWVGAGRRRNGIRPSFPFLGAEMRSVETNTWRISLPVACRARKLGFLFDSLAFGFFCEKSFFCVRHGMGATNEVAGGWGKGRQKFCSILLS